MHLTCYLYNLKKFFNINNLKLLVHFKWSIFVLNFDSLLFKIQLIRYISLIVTLIISIIIILIIPSLVLFFNFILAQLRDFFILFDLSLFSSLFDKIPDSIGNFYTTYINFLTDLIKNLKFILNFHQYSFLCDYGTNANSSTMSDNKITVYLMVENNNNNQPDTSNNNQPDTSNNNNVSISVDDPTLWEDYQEMRDRDLYDKDNLCKYMIHNNTLVTTLLNAIDEYEAVLDSEDSTPGQKLYACSGIMTVDSILQYKEPREYRIDPAIRSQVEYCLPNGNSISHDLEEDLRDADLTPNSHKVDIDKDK